jgi:hypothetical protein
MTDPVIFDCSGPLLDVHLNDLTRILYETVQAGASVGFVLPWSVEDSRSFWTQTVFPAVERRERLLLVAIQDDRAVGTVQLSVQMPPNQAHRGEVAKLLVHPDFRKQGIAKRLMVQLESRALSLQKRLVTLDTRTGDTAEPLYRSLGYQIAGVIPGYCRAPDSDRLDSTTYMYKNLSPPHISFL